MFVRQELHVRGARERATPQLASQIVQLDGRARAGFFDCTVRVQLEVQIAGPRRGEIARIETFRIGIEYPTDLRLQRDIAARGEAAVGLHDVELPHFDGRGRTFDRELDVRQLLRRAEAYAAVRTIALRATLECQPTFGFEDLARPLLRN